MTSCVLNNFADGDSTVSQDNLLQLLNFKRKKDFCCVQVEFHPFEFVPISLWPYQWALLRGVWLHFFILSHQLFIHNDEIPLEPSFLQAEELQLSQPRVIPPVILVPL